MMRPIYKYARTPGWVFDFAPHDCGQFPLVHGQVYADNHIEGQMPVEECGNMLVMAASVCIASGDTKFAEENLDLLEAWVKYLEAHGDDRKTSSAQTTSQDTSLTTATFLSKLLWVSQVSA